MTEPSDPFSPPSEPYGTPAPPPPPAYGAPQWGQPAPYGAPVPAGPRRNGFGIAALVLGVVSICGFTLVVPPVLAIVFGFLGRGRAKRGEATNKGMATAGAVLGVVTLTLSVLVYGLLIANFDAFQRYDDCNQAHVGDRQAQDQCARDFVRDVFGVDTSNR